MSIVLQSPGLNGRLHDALASASQGSVSGVGAFAFASAAGIDILAAEPTFQTLLGSGKFKLVVGLDAITDTKAVAALSTIKQELPNADVKLFYHSKGGALFHPKAMIFRRANGGVCITGSGNLTVGGLRNNWEGFWVADMDEAAALAAEAHWQTWLTTHAEHLLDMDDIRVTTQAALNAKTKSNIQKAATETDEELVGPLIEANSEATSLNPFLIAEVPKNVNRPGQADFNLDSYQSFFSMTLGKSRTVTFFHVKPSGALDPAENRQGIAAKSSNYRFEIGAMKGLHNDGNFILIFERIGNSEYKYVLLTPGDPGHAEVKAYLDANYIVTWNSKRRVVVTRNEVQAAWADNPLLKH